MLVDTADIEDEVLRQLQVSVRWLVATAATVVDSLIHSWKKAAARLLGLPNQGQVVYGDPNPGHQRQEKPPKRLKN